MELEKLNNPHHPVSINIVALHMVFLSFIKYCGCNDLFICHHHRNPHQPVLSIKLFLGDALQSYS